MIKSEHSSPLPDRSKLALRLACCFWLLVLTCLSRLDARAAANPPRADSSNAPRLIIISLDGMAAFYLDDPKADIPTLHKLMAEGASAKRMKAVLPTATWANHTSLITGVNPARHGVLANKVWDRQQGKPITLISDPVYNKDEIVKVPTLYDAAHDAGLKTLAILWPASRGAKTLDWTVPDVATDAHFQKYGTPELLAACRQQGIPIDKHQQWRDAANDEPRDKMYTDMFLYGLGHYHPQLALLHLINVDHTQHEHGPRSPEAYHALHAADQSVKQVLDLLAAKYPGQYTVMVVSDHGFMSYYQRIQPNVKFRQEGLLKMSGSKIAEAKVSVVSQGGSAFIYVLDESNRAKLTSRIAAMFKNVEGIDRIFTEKDYPAFGLASPRDNPWMADLVLSARDGYAFSEEDAGDALLTPKSKRRKGVHGNNPLQSDLHASFIAWGKGIKPGVKLGDINNLDVAPTAAALLGLKMNCDGRILKEILAR